MHSRIIKLVALIAILAGCFSCTKDRKTDDDNMGSITIQCSRTGAVDPNIISIALPDLVNAVCFEYPVDYHHWTITLMMAKGTDCTKLAPIITLAPGVAITPTVSGAVHDFTKGVDYILTVPDGSTVFYTVFASDDNRVSIIIQCAVTGAVDSNMVSFSIPGIVDLHCLEYLPHPNYADGGPNSWSPHEWAIHLVMAKGTDRTKLDPVITLSPGSTITPVSGTVHDFTNPVKWTLIESGGTAVSYTVYPVFVIGDPWRIIDYDDDGNQTIVIIYPDDPRYPY